MLRERKALGCTLQSAVTGHPEVHFDRCESTWSGDRSIAGGSDPPCGGIDARYRRAGADCRYHSCALWEGRSLLLRVAHLAPMRSSAKNGVAAVSMGIHGRISLSLAMCRAVVDRGV